MDAGGGAGLCGVGDSVERDELVGCSGAKVEDCGCRAWNDDSFGDSNAALLNDVDDTCRAPSREEPARGLRLCGGDALPVNDGFVLGAGRPSAGVDTFGAAPNPGMEF